MLLKKPVFHIFFKNDIADSISVIGLHKKQHIKIYYLDSIYVFKIEIPNDLFQHIHKRFLVYSLKERVATDYDFISPVVFVDTIVECQITKFGFSNSNSISCNLKQSDTVNLIKHLLNGDSIRINKVYSVNASRDIQSKDFTLLDYFGIKRK